jgi:hypothetical protein
VQDEDDVREYEGERERGRRKEGPHTFSRVVSWLRNMATFASVMGKAGRALVVISHPAMSAWYVSHHAS